MMEKSISGTVDEVTWSVRPRECRSLRRDVVAASTFLVMGKGEWLKTASGEDRFEYWEELCTDRQAGPCKWPPGKWSWPQAYHC